MRVTTRQFASASPGHGKLVFLVSIILLMNYIDRGNLATAAPLVKTELGLDDSQIGVLLSSFYWTYVAFMIPVGWATERFGAHRVLAVGATLWSVATLFTRGLTECLWSELEGTGVRAVSVHPGGIATGIARSARNVSQDAGFVARSREVLVTPPELCAAQILAGVRAGKRRILTGSRARTVDWLARLFPESYPGVLRRLSGDALGR
ncbi:MAG: MFS transporter [Gammaproteobacteria bacterium]